MHACMHAGRGGEMNEHSSDAVQNLVGSDHGPHDSGVGGGDREILPVWDVLGRCWGHASDSIDKGRGTFTAPGQQYCWSANVIASGTINCLPAEPNLIPKPETELAVDCWGTPVGGTSNKPEPLRPKATIEMLSLNAFRSGASSRRRPIVARAWYVPHSCTPITNL